MEWILRGWIELCVLEEMMKRTYNEKKRKRTIH